jgi:hypothetical protein
MLRSGTIEWKIVSLPLKDIMIKSLVSIFHLTLQLLRVAVWTRLWSCGIWEQTKQSKLFKCQARATPSAWVLTPVICVWLSAVPIKSHDTGNFKNIILYHRQLLIIQCHRNYNLTLREGLRLLHTQILSKYICWKMMLGSVSYSMWYLSKAIIIEMYSIWRLISVNRGFFSCVRPKLGCRGNKIKLYWARYP